jgi:hypothetical protein
MPPFALAAPALCVVWISMPPLERRTTTILVYTDLGVRASLTHMTMRALAVCLILSTSAYADTRKVEPFHGVSVSCVLDVEVAVGGTAKLELSGPAEWTARITTKVSDGVLHVDMPGTYRDVPKMQLHITTPSLDAIDLTGVVDLRAKNLTGKTLTLTDSGVGTVELAGRVDTLSVDVSGAGTLRAKDLVADRVTVGVSGAGQASVHATKVLAATLSGAGHIDVYGHPPAIAKDISGVGTIRIK